MTKIYISSTYSDLIEYRQAVYDILRKMRYEVMAMEDYVATDERPLDKCIADVASCQIYVGIFAWRYGFIPPGYQHSITELEYRQASESGIPRFIFLLHDDAPWPRSKMEGGVGGQRIEALRAKLGERHLVQFFKTPEELADQVAASIAEWVQARLDDNIASLRAKQAKSDEERREIRERQRVVNLRPLDVTHTFKDRFHEQENLRNYLTTGNVRLVGLIGRGGMGKTALASRVLADLERGKLLFPGEDREQPIDGIIYLSTRSTGLSLERIYTDIGRMLGEPVMTELADRWVDKEVPLEAKVEYLLETMQNGLYLILLDNLEDELAEDGTIQNEGLRLFIEQCLTQPSGARLIVTSRQQVNITAAALPWMRNILLREGLPIKDAVALLHEFDPDGVLGLRDASEADLMKAAAATRGIPRALEILAGILQQDPATSLSRLLANRNIFGTEVVEKLVAEGYHRLGENEQRAMEALAVFDLPVDETAIIYLLHPWLPGLDVHETLRHLVSGHFASVNRDTGEYSLHPLDREYAYHQIPPPDRVEILDSYNQRSLELRAADFYQSIRKPEREWQSLEDLAPQLAEFEHLVRARDYDRAAQVLHPIDSEYLLRWGYYARLAELREKLLGQLTLPELQMSNLAGLGIVYRLLGRVDEAVVHFDQALSIARETNNRQGEGVVLGHLGSIYHELGYVEKCIKFLENALVIAQEFKDRRKEGIELGHLGLAYCTLGKTQEGMDYYKQSLAIAREIGDRREEGMQLGNLGSAYRDIGRTEQAIDYYQQALVILRETGDRRGECFQLGRLGRGYYKLDQLDKSIKYLEEALSLARQINSRRQECIWLGHMGLAYYASGRVERAIELYQEGLVIAREINDRREQGLDLGRSANAYRDLGQVERAIELYEEALAIAREIGDRRKAGDWLGGLGRAHHDLGQFERAVELYQAAKEIAEEIGDRQGAGMWYNYLGSVYHDLGEFEQAIEFSQQALDIARDVNNRRGESYPLFRLSQALLVTGKLAEARQHAAKALELDVPATSYPAALVLAIVMLRQKDPDADAKFMDAASCCRAMLEKTPSLYKVRYILATALVGTAVCDPGWAEVSQHPLLLTPALQEFQRVLEISRTPGLIYATLHNLKMIQQAGVDGLEPVFDLMEK